ncbi:integral membrane efflux protein [Leifsonia xyli subsp. cynodontis DSM 46306]|uniref:Major facilitator superfamily (MFS) profile domain-containing protein n=2 Tax=Leifsonia xyli TaxID=1575 RepID=U3P818_LEIXC|nr:integral membrane efflux protein [Leifsonia xyli subsp. cynodontis DSM 46306]
MTNSTAAAAPPTGPMLILSARPPWRETFVSLRIPNYRRFTAGNLVANTAAWMQRIAMDWLVLQLSGSVAAVGVTVFMQFAPMLLFGLWGGVIADRHSKQRLLIITQSASAALAALLAVLTLSGTVEVCHVYLISFALGLVTVVDNPARQVFVNELVGPRHLRNAISLNSSIFQLGGLIGPALAGLMIAAVGGGWSFAINAVACLAVVAALLALRKGELHHSPAAPRGKGQLAEGIRYVRRKPVIFWTVVMVAVLAVFAFNMPVFLAAYANEVFDAGAQGYGIFNALVAAGALAGALSSTRRTSVRLSTVIGTAATLGIVQTLAGFAPDEVAFSVLLVGIGVGNLLFITAANSLVQMSSNVQIRGRAISVYILVLLGGQALGGPLMGWVVEALGPHSAMAVSGLVPTAAAIVVGLLIARGTNLRLRLRRSGRMPVVTIVTRAGKAGPTL